MPRDKYGLPGIYNSSLPTIPDGKGSALAVDSNGRLLVSGGGGGALTVGGVYNSTPPTLTNGQTAPLQLDSSGNQKVTEATLLSGEDQTNNLIGIGYKPVVSSTYSALGASVASDVDVAVKATAGNMLYIRATNANAAVRYLQLHNKATAPVNPDVPARFWLIPAGTATQPAIIELGRETFGQGGFNLGTGLALGISTTAATFTGATAADHTLDWEYV